MFNFFRSHTDNGYSVGSYVKIGTDDIGREMYWTIVEFRNKMSEALIVMNGALTNHPYHEPGGETYWADCTLREWLNTYFLDIHLTEEERSRIISVVNTNENNPNYLTSGGPATKDMVFILSLSEMQRYFKRSNRWNGYHCWLRTPGSTQDKAMSITFDGKIIDSGTDVNDDLCVRAAMWVTID